ncbi:MAG TPA: gamma-glutamyltransferase [Phycisphaerales bacterium]|nr:gamma-glutamyltransferase [Phycisphaerales bacterium]HRQ75982.1 gamma-glutamyltransferase [Phycisphaerales bacterium]
MVATSQPLAAQAGLQMIASGGNAMDAAIAVAAALTVVEPTANGIGSDAFALIWAGGGLHGLNASGRAPAHLTADHFAGQETISQRGWDGVTVPGAVSAWVEVHRKFGSLPFEKLLEPAIRYARDGYLVSPQTASGWRNAVRAYRQFESWQSTFAPGGRSPRAGEKFTLPHHATTLEDIAATAGESFYRGDLAQKVAAHARETGGLITEDDLADHASDWVRPISLDYRGLTLHEIPPNGQGLAALLMLGIVQHFDLASMEVDSADWLHVQIEAMKLAFADAHRYIADPDWLDVDITSLLDGAYLQSRAALIDRTQAQDFAHGAPKPGGTVLLATADASGNMVSFIQSNYTGFGSGIVVPNTGIAMQNRGCCFTLEQGHPNAPGPRKRPYHTIIPGFVTRNDKPIMAFGVMGGYMQPQGHAQVMIRLADHNQNPQAALDAPRWQVEKGLKVSIEPGFAPDVYASLRERGHDLAVADARTVAHGGAQAIYKLDDGYFGASDLRRDGQAVGF